MFICSLSYHCLTMKAPFAFMLIFWLFDSKRALIQHHPKCVDVFHVTSIWIQNPYRICIPPIEQNPYTLCEQQEITFFLFLTRLMRTLFDKTCMFRSISTINCKNHNFYSNEVDFDSIECIHLDCGTRGSLTISCCNRFYLSYYNYWKRKKYFASYF